jgi:fused signal recognition particle receptor
VSSAKARHSGVLVVDTAGRLHNKQNLMDELNKIRRVIAREAPDAKCTTLLVIDATTGQNAVVQAKLFREAASVDGVVITKLDGNAKGGVAIAVAFETHVPILLAGLGEKVDDLVDFDSAAFSDSLLPS